MKSVSLLRPKSRRYLACALLAALLAGCASGPSQQTSGAIEPLGRAPLSAEIYATRAQQSQGDQRLSLILLAARAHLQQNNTSAAETLLNSISSQLPTTGPLQGEYRLLQARLLSDSPTKALSLLQIPTSWNLSADQWRDYFSLRAHFNGQIPNHLQQAYALYGLGKFLSADQQVKNNNNVWDRLAQLPTDTLKTAMIQSGPGQWQDWLELALLVKQQSGNTTDLQSALDLWKMGHPTHPAAQQWPEGLVRQLNSQPFGAQQVAILLPLSGRVASQAQAIQEGILANMLANGDERTVRFYDTNANDAVTAYQTAVSEGAEFVIGPLLKQNVENVLAQYDSKVPLLVLNNHQSGVPQAPNLFFFSLSPEQEAAQAALHIQQQGRSKPLVLAADDAISRRMAQGFIQQWQQHDPKPVPSYYFQNQQAIRDLVRQALHVDQSTNRINAMKRIFGTGLETEFRTRRDIDSVYLIANGADIMLLKPFIDVSLSAFADPLHLYTSSRANREIDSATAQDLEGVQLSDMGFLLGQTPEKARIQTLWPNNSQALMRLYAFGHDSWSLIDNLSQMRASEEHTVQGLSGVLSLDPKGELLRQPAWGQYQQGTLNAL